MKALIIDDDPIIRMLASKMLEVKSYSVETVSDQKSLEDFVSKNTECPNLILLDLQIGEMSGPDAYKILIAAYGSVNQLICMSSHTVYEAEEIFPNFAMEIDIEDKFLQKPFPSAKLYELI